jgi:hypothetical protein
LELAEKAIDLEAGCAALALQLEESKIVDWDSKDLHLWNESG